MSTNLPAAPGRSDWTLLLPPIAHPAPQHERRLLLLGGNASVVGRLQALGLADSVVRCTGAEWVYFPSQSFDALVVLHNAPDESLFPTPQTALWQLLEKLRPSAVLFIEINRRQRRYWRWTPAHLRRLLKRQKFDAVAQHWVAPNFENSRRYLPLDVPQIFRWYFDNLYVAATPLQRAAQLAGRLAGRWFGQENQLLAALLPCYCLTAVGPQWAEAGNLEAAELKAGAGEPALLAQAARATYPAEVGADFALTRHTALLTSGFDAGSRSVLLPFASAPAAGRAPNPTSVIKVATRAELGPNTVREQQRLVALRGKLSPALRSTLPQPLGHFGWTPPVPPNKPAASEDTTIHVSVERYAPGPSLFATLRQWPPRPRAHDRYLREVTQWLVHFQQQTQPQHIPWDESAVARWVGDALGEYEKTLGATPAERRLFEAAQQRATALIGNELPLVWAHYDLAPWNIHHDGHQLTVIDWEFGRQADDQRGLPLCDLLYFALYFQVSALRLDGAEGELTALRNLYCPTPPRAAGWAVQQAFATYERAFALDQRFRPLLLTLLWVEQALHQAARQQLLRIGEPKGGALSSPGNEAKGNQAKDQAVRQQNVSNPSGGMSNEASINLVRQRSRAVAYLAALAHNIEELFG